MLKRPHSQLRTERLEDRLTPAGPMTELAVFPRSDYEVKPDLLVHKPPVVEPALRDVAVGYSGGSIGPFSVRLYENQTTYREFVTYDVTFGPSSGVHVATGDVTGDGVTDVVTGMAPIVSFTGSPHTADSVKVFDGTTLGQRFPTPIAEFDPYGSSFTGGCHVACADLDGDGRAEVIVCRDNGGLATTKVFNGADLAAGTATAVAAFEGIDGDPNALGGAHIAAGDMNGDGTPDVAVGSANGPRVAVFDGTSLQAGETPAKLFGDFFAFDPATHKAGINVAIADLDADGYGELMAGSRTGAPRMVVLDGQDLIASIGATRTVWWDRLMGDTTSTGGLRIAAKDLDGDRRGDFVLSHGTGSRVTTIRGALVVPGGPHVMWPGQFDAINSWWTTANGVWVG